MGKKVFFRLSGQEIDSQAAKNEKQGLLQSHKDSHGSWDSGFRPISNIDNALRFFAAILSFWTGKKTFCPPF